LLVDNFDENTGITLESLANDWSRLYIADLCDNDIQAKLSKSLQPGKDRVSRYIVLKFGFDYKNTDTLYTIDHSNTKEPIERHIY
jgi:hypothetical protein